MAQAPVHKLKKDEIIWLASHRCNDHKHTYLTHYSCYLKDHPEEEERLAFFDIEASNLDADYGIMLSWAIKPSDSKTVIGDVLTPADVKKGYEDKRIVQSCIDALAKFNRVVTYYGTGFDLPFLRARALIVGVDFPTFGSLKHKDLYYIVKSKFKLSSRRLENACRQLLGATDKTRIDAKYWRNGVRGDKDSLKYIYDHNLHDVIDLEKLYYKVIDFSKTNNTSI
jgi:uncharacterized protein YprB with RNaseH-like and TPR domain